MTVAITLTLVLIVVFLAAVLLNKSTRKNQEPTSPPMNISFRQGLISFPTGFLQAGTGSGVSLITTSGRITAAFAHGDSDYLQVFDTNVTNAWPNIAGGGTSYLFADIDQVTAVVTFGVTMLLPVISSIAPVSPANTQHWFDLGTTTMKVWSTASSTWQTKIRVFFGSVPAGNTGAIISQLSGTQVALNTPSDPGFIMKDSFQRPLRKSTGEFLTTTDDILVNNTSNSGVLVQPTNSVFIVKAAESIPAMSLVYISGENVVRKASSDPALSPAHVPQGIVLAPMAPNDVGQMVTSGEVSYDQWDFTGSAGAALYIDANGVLTLARPAGVMAYRVGFVKNKNTIIVGVDAETFPQVYTTGANSLVISGTSPIVVADTTNGLGERVVTISTAGGGGGGGSTTFAALTDKTTVDLVAINTPLTNALNLKANVSALNTTNSNLAAKADTTTVNTALGLKADTSSVNTALGLKADAASTTTALSNKSDINHTHTSSAITDFAEAVDDRVGALLVAGSGATVVYNDAAGTITIGSAGGGVTTFAGLSDKTSVDLVAINTPLSTALAAKAPLQVGALASSGTSAPNATAVINAIAAKPDLQSGVLAASTTVAPNATAVQNAISALNAVQVAYTTAIPLTNAGHGKYMPRTTLATNTTFSVGSAAVEQGLCMLNLVSNGTAVPTFPAPFIVSGAAWPTTPNQQIFYWIMYVDGVALVTGVLGAAL